MARLDAGLPGDSLARGRRQCRGHKGSGRARNRARAPLNWDCQGQPRGRCRVRRRALQVEASGQGEETPAEGLGGRRRLA